MTTKVSWKCESCNIELEPEKMVEHLYEVHKLQKGKIITSKKRLIVTADAPGYAMQQYKWIIEGLELTQTVEIEGAKTPFKDLDVR